MTLKQLEKKIAAMEKRLAKLEKGGRRPAKQKPSRVRAQTHRAPRSGTNPLTTRARQKSALEKMHAEGLIVTLPDEAQKRVARWRALPERERNRILEEFSKTPLEKPLSQIVLENRR
jgi:hypothetical protein